MPVDTRARRASAIIVAHLNRFWKIGTTKKKRAERFKTDRRRHEVDGVLGTNAVLYMIMVTSSLTLAAPVFYCPYMILEDSPSGRPIPVLENQR